LTGRASVAAYALFLRNLLPAYEAMERGLDRHRAAPGVRLVARREVFRGAALAADLEALHGAGWRDDLPVLPAARRYADRVAAATVGGGAGLIAHAYVRYLGDLNGGRVMKTLLARSLGLGPHLLAFYDFPEIADLASFKADYRQGLDSAEAEIGDVDAVVEEGFAAFELNIAVSDAVAAAC
jgi:heme oxygenase